VFVVILLAHLVSWFR